jgi:cobalt-zinc-cadmium efflux system outer membrane protein
MRIRSFFFPKAASLTSIAAIVVGFASGVLAADENLRPSENRSILLPRETTLAGGPVGKPEMPASNISGGNSLPQSTAPESTRPSSTALPPSSAAPAKSLQTSDKPNGENLTPEQKSAKDEAIQATVEYYDEVPDTSKFPPLPVVDALNTALIESPRAAAIRAQFGITEAGYAMVTQAPNPFFLYDRGMVAEQENRIGPILTEEPPWKIFFRYVSQKRLVDQTRLDLMTQLWQLRSDVRRAYTEVVVAQETLKTLNELYDLSAKLENVASKRFQAGDVPELDALKARLATSQANVDRVVGAQRVVRARQQLSIILGRGVESPINIPGLPDYTGGNKMRFELKADKTDVLPDFSKSVEPLSIFESMAEENRLELKSLAVQRKLNDVNLKGAYGNMIPNPSLAFGKSVQGNVPTGPKLTAVFFTLNAPLPTVNFNQGPVYQYKATGRQLKYQTAAQRNQIGTDVASAYQNLLAQREKLRTYQEHVLAESFEVARLARRSYEVGQSDITATLAAQQANVQVRSAYLDAVQSYQLAFTDLEQACGTPLE